MFDPAQFATKLLQNMGLDPETTAAQFRQMVADANTVRAQMAGAQQATAGAVAHFNRRLDVLETNLAELSGQVAELTALVRLVAGSQPVPARQVVNGHDHA